ncbi:MAG TPA: MFS transporter [Candidatus Dojkabacteria bacterium]|nr:MFS transporter [Candidatus Dojkabacteria bacterium]
MKLKLTDVQRLIIGRSLQALGFWVPIALLYYRAQGLTDEQAFTVIGALQLMLVLLEYPTGVIGDTYGHKVSVVLGYLFAGTATILLGSSLSIPLPMIYFYLFLFAVGGTLISGSDVAMLHTISKDFKADMANLGKTSGWFTTFGLIVGGLVATIDLRIPFLLSGIAMFISAILISKVKVKHSNEDGDNVFTIAKLGMREAFFNLKIFIPVFFSAVFTMFLLSEKWVLPAIFEQSNIPLAFFGIVTAVVTISRGQASGLYKKFKDVNYWILITLMLLSSVLISFPYISLLGLALVYGFSAYIITQSDVAINENVDSRARASIISFRNLLSRLFNSPYVFIIGLASAELAFPQVNIVMSITVLIFVLIIWGIYRMRVKYSKV